MKCTLNMKATFVNITEVVVKIMPEKIQGCEPMTSAIPVRCTTN